MNFFKKPSVEEQLKLDLEDAKRNLLQAEHWADYHQQQVKFYKLVLSRLQNYVENGVK